MRCRLDLARRASGYTTSSVALITQKVSVSVFTIRLDADLALSNSPSRYEVDAGLEERQAERHYT
jgi:hypothetical protein